MISLPCEAGEGWGGGVKTPRAIKPNLGKQLRTHCILTKGGNFPAFFIFEFKPQK